MRRYSVLMELNGKPSHEHNCAILAYCRNIVQGRIRSQWKTSIPWVGDWLSQLRVLQLQFYLDSFLANLIIRKQQQNHHNSFFLCWHAGFCRCIFSPVFFSPRDFLQPSPTLFSFHMWIEVFSMETEIIPTALLKIKNNNIISSGACWISGSKQITNKPQIIPNWSKLRAIPSSPLPVHEDWCCCSI